MAYANALSAQQGLSQCYTLFGCSGTPGVFLSSCTGVTFAGTSCPGYRLPTDAEWEYAARAGDPRAFYTGDITACSIMMCVDDPALDMAGWYCQNSMSTTHAVSGKTPNAWGLYDMLGNVWEWCGDWYGTYPGTNTPDYAGSAMGSSRARRGGSEVSNAVSARAARRGSLEPDFRDFVLGFRLCRSVVP